MSPGNFIGNGGGADWRAACASRWLCIRACASLWAWAAALSSWAAVSCSWAVALFSWAVVVVVVALVGGCSSSVLLVIVSET